MKTLKIEILKLSSLKLNLKNNFNKIIIKNKLKLKSLIIVALSIFNTSFALAQLDLKVGEINYGGNGCPAGSINYSVDNSSSEFSSLTLLFDKFAAETGPINKKTLDRKSCNFAIPLDIPSGYQFAIMAIDYKGFALLPKLATAAFKAEYFFAGQKAGLKKALALKGPISKLFNTEHIIPIETQIWSGCGEDAIFRINSNITLKNKSGKNAVVMIDHADLKSGVVFKIAYKKC